MQSIYLDNNATTALDKDVKKALTAHIEKFCANPSSLHTSGREAKKHLLSAKILIANHLLVKKHEIIFTSSATEALNMVIKGSISKFKKPHILTTDIEHVAIYNTLKHLEENLDVSVTYLNTKNGYPTIDQIKSAIKDNTKLFVFSAVNSQTGIKADYKKIAALAKEKNIAFILDAVAIIGKDDFTIEDGITSACFSSHKIHGPKGIGFAYINKGHNLPSLLHGGGQEYNYRAGTENVLGIIGLAKAIEIISKTNTYQTIEKLRDYFEDTLKDKIPSIIIHGKKENRVCNISNIAFPTIDGKDLLILLDKNNIEASFGSACSSGDANASRVLLNMGIDEKIANSSIRFSLSKYTTKDQLDKTIDVLCQLIKNKY
jgi:cysteine desulfurase